MIEPQVQLLTVQYGPDTFFNVGPPKEDIFSGHLYVLYFNHHTQLQITNFHNYNDYHINVPSGTLLKSADIYYLYLNQGTLYSR